jgi:hypothetical protein
MLDDRRYRELAQAKERQEAPNGETEMPLRDDLDALTAAALNEERDEGSADAASKLFEVTRVCEDQANRGLRTAAFPAPVRDAAFLTRGTALALHDLLVAEGLSVRVIPYKDTNFYLDINW